MKLFCIPYAGGSASNYTRWNKYLHNSINLYPMELAGRGMRYSKPLYNSINEAVDDLYNLIKGELNNEPYAFFGHSMGSLLVYELGIKIIEKHNSPVHVFVSGGTAPQARVKTKPTHNLPLEEFKKEILRYEGTPATFFDNKELLDLFLPVLRSDIKIMEEYDYPYNRVFEPFKCPISVFHGKTDFHAPSSTISEWRKLTTEDCRIYPFEGGHFFIHDYEEEIVEIINQTLIGF